jgi:hypothetical protein
VGEGVGQREPEGLQDLNLLDGLLHEGEKTRNVHLRSARWMDADATR